MQPITPANVADIIKRLNRRHFIVNPMFLIINCQFEEKDGELMLFFNEKELAIPTRNPEHMRGKIVRSFASEIPALEKTGLTIKHREPQGTEYFYETQKFIDLAGKPFKKIRKSINGFKKTYDYRLETTCRKEQALAFLENWYQKNVGKKSGYNLETFHYEYHSTREMLNLLESLPWVNRLFVFVGDELVAMAIFCGLYDDFWVGISQKINTTYKGVGKFLHHEKAKLMASRRECSLGDDGLDPKLAEYKRHLQPTRTDDVINIEFA